MESVYEKLAHVKKSNESFSELFSRLLEKGKPPLEEFYGAWNVRPEEEKKILHAMKNFRREFEESFKHHESSWI